MSTAARNAAAATRLVAAFVEHGVRHAVVAPGSRSAPLAIALDRDGRIAVHVVLDERAAAFRALGIGRATGTPAVALCTSGTAGTHFHAAVVEAHHGRVPLIVCTADRPPELQGVGAPQTIDQRALFGPAVRWSAEPGPPDDVGAPDWAELGARAVAATRGVHPGPVHLNLAFREPLVAVSLAPASPGAASSLRTDSLASLASDPPVAASLAPASLASDPPVATSLAPASPASDPLVAAAIASARRVLVVCGWGSASAHDEIVVVSGARRWPVLADAISGLRTGAHAVAHYEALLRAPGFGDAHRPDLVVRVGGPPTSKTLGQWLDNGVPQILVDPAGVWLDPQGSAAMRVQCEPAAFFAALGATPHEGAEGADSWFAAWRDADDRASSAIDAVADGEPLAVREVWRALPDEVRLLVASSMPVRDLEWFASSRTGVHAHANRGVNGIDGLVSTALGIATGSDAPTVAVLGDLAFLHDAGGLLGASTLSVDCTLVVIANAGGGIFSFLPQADPDVCAPDEFERLFGTPQTVDVAAVASAYGVHVEVAAAQHAARAVRKALAAGGVHVIVVPSDRVANVAAHRRIWDAVAASL